MRPILFNLTALALAAVVGPVWAAAPSPAAFGRLPDVQTAVISPDGSRIAILGGPAQTPNLTISTIDGGKPTVVGIGDVTVRTLQWAGNDYLLLRTSVFDSWRTPASNQVISDHYDRDVVMDRQGKVVGRLLSNSTVSNFATRLPILGVVETPAPTAYVAGYDWSLSMMSPDHNTRFERSGQVINKALWQVDVATGRGKLVERAQTEVADWDLDLTGEARVRMDYDLVTGSQTYVARPKGASAWKPFHSSSDPFEAWTFLGYSDPEDSIYVWEADDRGQTGTIVRQNLKTGERSAIGAEQGGPSAAIEWDDFTKAPVAIRSEGDHPTFQWLDPTFGAVHGKLQRVFKGKTVWLRNWSRDRTRFIVEVEAPEAPPAWYLFDAKLGQVSSIGEAYPELAGTALGKTTWITYKAADGLTIPAYLTLPAGAAADARLPLIVMPHGGPASRDHYRFDWWAQFLAAKGYAVLQPQFRGSGGFGPAFERAGDKEWGGKMQTDLLDGVHYLAEQKTIDPDRVCIVGGSFGGYAALAGASLHPEAYRCAVSVAGVTDLINIQMAVKAGQGERSPVLDYWRRIIGRTHADNALLIATSPARQVDKIRAPILLIHGEQDTTVPYGQSVLMRDALTKAGKPVEFVTLQGDDHYLSRSTTRTKMLDAISQFLARNLPVEQAGAVRSASAASAARGG